MITREEGYAWLDRQIEGLAIMSEQLDGIGSFAGEAKEIHIFGFKRLLEILGCPFVRAYHTENTDELYFTYRGVKFFGLSWEKRIGKKAS